MEERIADIITLIEKHDYKAIREYFEGLQEEDIADIIENIDPEYAPLLFRMLHKSMAIYVFEDLETDKQVELLNHLSDQRIRDIIDTMDSDERTELFEEAPAKVVNRLFSMLDHEQRKLTYRILGYPEDSIGRLINTRFMPLRVGMTVKTALNEIRTKGKHLETVFYMYLLDEQRKLFGVISLKDLVMADENEVLENIAETNIVTVNPYMDQEAVIAIFEKYDLIAIPVVDREERLLGIVTFDDVADIIEEEHEEDLRTMAAIGDTDEPYMESSVWFLVRKRFIWLFIFLLIETLSGFIMQHYDGFLKEFIILSFFIPMLLNAGGTAGAQTSTLIIRGIAVGEVQFSHLARILLKETFSALIIGSLLSIVVIVRVVLMKLHISALRIILAVSFSLISVIWLANIIAAALPLLVKKLGIDPALMSAPLVTTAVDVIGLLIYFRIALLFLGG